MNWSPKVFRWHSFDCIHAQTVKKSLCFLMAQQMHHQSVCQQSDYWPLAFFLKMKRMLKSNCTSSFCNSAICGCPCDFNAGFNWTWLMILLFCHLFHTLECLGVCFKLALDDRWATQPAVSCFCFLSFEWIITMTTMLKESTMLFLLLIIWQFLFPQWMFGCGVVLWTEWQNPQQKSKHSANWLKHWKPNQTVETELTFENLKSQRFARKGLCGKKQWI